MEIGKNPHVIASKDVREIKKNVIFLGKGGFLWNVIWPIGEQTSFDLTRNAFNDDEDLSDLSI